MKFLILLLMISSHVLAQNNSIEIPPPFDERDEERRLENVKLYNDAAAEWRKSRSPNDVSGPFRMPVIFAVIAKGVKFGQNEVMWQSTTQDGEKVEADYYRVYKYHFSDKGKLIYQGKDQGFLDNEREDFCTYRVDAIVGDKAIKIGTYNCRNECNTAAKVITSINPTR